MTTTSLTNLSIAELQQLTSDIKLELKKREQQKVIDARQQILLIAQSVGMDVKDLVGKHSKDKPLANKVPVKYRNPADPQQEWTGRGRKPKWMETMLASGKTLAEMGV